MPEQLGLLAAVEQQPVPMLHEQIVIRESSRARRLILQVVPPARIELVVPRGTRPRTVENFVSSNEAWIARARDEIAQRFTGDRSLMPARIELRSSGETLSVRYECRPAQSRRISLRQHCLHVRHHDRAGADVIALLRRWLMRAARERLQPQFAAVAREAGLKPRRVQFRLQRTRWGSCSATGTISLNASALLLEPALVRYLFIHELCHLVHMNHSARYWALVRRLEPDYEDLDRALGRAWSGIPWWVIA